MSGLFATLQKSFLFLIVFFCLIFAQASDKFSTRYRAPATVTALQGPYTYMDTVNCASADWSVPDGYLICEMRTTDSCLVKLQLRSRDSITVRCAANDVLRLDILKIYSTGTDSGVRSGNKIRVFGIRN